MSLLRSRSDYSKTEPVILNDANTEMCDTEIRCQHCRCSSNSVPSEHLRTRAPFVLEVEEELNEKLSKLLSDYESAKESVLHQADEAWRKAEFVIDNNRHEALNRLEAEYEHKRQDVQHRARQHIWMLECRERKAESDANNMKHAQRPLLNQIVTSLPNPTDFQLFTVHWPGQESSPRLSPAKSFSQPEYYQPIFNGHIEFPLIYKKPYLAEQPVHRNNEYYDDKLENSPP